MRLTDDDVQEVLLELHLPPEFAAENGIGESHVQLDHRLGNFSRTQIWFDGIHLSYGMVALNQPVRIRVEMDTPVLEMHFSLHGSFRSQLTGSSVGGHTYNHQQHNLIYTPGFEGRFEIDSTENQLFEVNFSESYVNRFIAGNEKLMRGMAEQMARREIALLSRHNRPITPAMNALIRDIMDCRKTGLMKRLFLEAKVLELFMLQLEQFNTDVPTERDTCLKTGDHERLEAAKALLEGDLQAPGSLLSIAHQVGLNDYKLKRGFKEVYGTTLFGYWHDLRMAEARRLLCEGKKAVGEVADAIGYQNPHHFTAAFKKKYGVLPSQLNR
ncbi:helix-turn-helix transcriptional regulator [Larkinella terrae]|nr:AraC family transcriptional regulator [Larkinella terrae]